MYDDDMIEISVNEYEELRNRVSDHSELLEQLATIYESLSIDLVELGEVDLEEALEQATRAYEGDQSQVIIYMIWTAISYNWATGCTGLYVFHGSHSQSQASIEFVDRFPGENLLALVAGSHKTSSKVYPLLVPDISKLRQEEKDDNNT